VVATTNYPSVLAITTAVSAAAALIAVLMISNNDPASAQIGPTDVPGTTITVDTTKDELNTDGDCSLREAIEAANTNLGVDACKAGSATQKRDAIHFALGQRAKIVLSSGLPTITDSAGLNINGLKSKITVSGNDQVRVFSVGQDAKLTLERLTVADGRTEDFGGGIFNDQGTLKVFNSTFSGNSADVSASANGAGIFNDQGTLEVFNSTFSKNSAGNLGGGIENFQGTLKVFNSTFSKNRAGGGGGIFTFAGTLEVSNSTFSENSADHGGGIYKHLGGATLSNTIVANSPSGGNCGSELITDGGYNVDDGTTCGFEEANNSKPSTDPRLDPDGLKNNGGPTRTIALLRGSPAINAIPQGDNGCATTIRKDQRGVTRPQGAGCDIGAFEKEQ
jgi:CSLREA domain-containing protein